MSEHQTPCNDFLFLNATLQEVVEFAKTNHNFKPQPSIELLNQFDDVFQSLLIQSQELWLLPERTLKPTLENISAAYTETYRGLTALYMSAPVPEDAAGWFDYQKELHAREAFLNNLEILLTWHSELYDEVVRTFPLLPVPFPVKQSKRNDTASGSDLIEQSDADIQQAIDTGFSDGSAPEIFLE